MRVASTVLATDYQLFDNPGRMTQMAQITDGRTYTSKYTYNLSGALVEETYPSGRKVRNEFELDGDLSAVASRKNAASDYMTYASGFSYTASGGIKEMRLGNGLWENAAFNRRLQVTQLGLGNAPAAAGVWKTDYDYGELDANGDLDPAKNTPNIARQTLTVPGASFVQSYKYDSLYRIKEARETTGGTQNWIQNWDYDRYGNRISFTQNIAGNTSAPNPAIDPTTNRFNLGQGFGYDANGNVVADTDRANLVRSFVFNGDNKQSKMFRNGQVVGEYFYDGEGKRVKKRIRDAANPNVVDEEIIFVYSAGKLIAEYSTRPVTDPKINYTTTDHLGSPRVVTDQFGRVISRRDFMPFGEELLPNAGSRANVAGYTALDNVRQKFTGYQKDEETNLDFAEARMYENRFGRFTAVDPLLASGRSASPQTFNRYAYVRNAPLILVDPTGLIGDYYDRKGRYIGSDGNPDGLVWFADEKGRDEQAGIIYVENEVQTSYVEVAKLRRESAKADFSGITGDFRTILDRANFYGGFQASFSNGTRWAGAASKVAEDVDMLTWRSSRFFGYSNDELAGFASEGNRSIFEDVFSKLVALRSRGTLSPQEAYAWDAMTLSQEQHLVQPGYEKLSRESFNLLQTGVRQQFLLSRLANPNSDPFPNDRNLLDVSHRWEYGMNRGMGYNVTAEQMPHPGDAYRNGEMWNRLNPGNPVGPIVKRFRF